MSDSSPRGTCQNCDAPLAGAYCATCGQRTRHGRLNWRDLLRDVNEQLVEGNLPWPRTIGRLTVDPGAVARDYVAGKRARYVHPLKCAFYLVLIASIVAPASGFSMTSNPFTELPAWRAFLLENRPVFMLLLSPVTVILLRISFWRMHFNLIEIWVFSLYMLGQLSILFVLVAFIDNLMVQGSGYGSETVQIASGLVGILIPILYFMWGVRGFFQARWDWSLVGALATIFGTFWVAGLVFRWLTGIA